MAASQTTTTTATTTTAGLTTSSLDRDTVIRIAGDLLDAEDLDSVNLTRIAEAAGVTQPALYRHIENLGDLWRAVGLATRADLAEALTQAGVGRSGPDAVRSVAAAWRDYGRRHPGRYRSTERYAVAGDPELEAAVERVVDVLTRSLRGFGMSDADETHGALSLRSALHGFVAFELGDGNPGPVDPDDSFEHLVQLLCSGFEAAAVRTAGSTDSATSPTEVN